MSLILTKAGLNAYAQSEATGIKLQASHMAVGDGGGAPVVHTDTSEALVNETWRGELQKIEVAASGEVEFQGHVPITVGGWYIREVAIYADDTLLAIGSHPDVWKPAPEAPDKVELLVTAPVQFTNSDIINLTVDTTKVLASQEMVADAIADHDADEAAHSGLLAAVSDHAGRIDNPHGVTKGQVGLGNIPNATSDSFNLNNPNYLATAKAVYDAYQTLFGALPGAATTDAAGLLELLTDTEALAGADVARAATAANIKAVLGARGLWKDAVYVPAPMDWDNLIEPGVYRPNAASGNLNAPPSGGNTWYIVLVLRAASTSLLQIAWPMAATNIPRIHVRKFVGDWMPWETIYTDYNGIVSSVGTRTTTGTWTLTGLTIGRPVYLVMTSTYTAAIDISYLVLSGAANLSSTVAGSQHFVGQRGNSASPPNVGVIIPTATSVEISVVTISTDTTLMAYQ